VAKEGSQVKTIRFGEQGAKTADKPKPGEGQRMKKSVHHLKHATQRTLLKERCLLLTGQIR
jgi:hypothetical protein